jgi:hypothetical protein
MVQSGSSIFFLQLERKMPAESSRNTGHGLILVPQPPSVRTIFFAEGGKKRLIFPYTLFGMFYFRTPQHQYLLKRLHVIFGQEPFTGKEDEKLYGLPVRNHDGAFATCFYHWPGEQTAEKFAHLIINQYWMSPYAEYNDWASWWTQRYTALNPTFAAQWDEATKAKNYRWILEQEFLQPDHHVTLGKLLEANKSHYAAGGIEVVNLVPPKVEFVL